MERRKGEITVHRMWSVKDMGIGNPEPHVDRVIKVFLAIGEAVAARWIQMPNAILLLQVAPDDPASGAVYVYDRVAREFYMLSFEGEDEHLTVEEFSQLLAEYNLLQYAEKPSLLQSQVQLAAAA